MFRNMPSIRTLLRCFKGTEDRVDRRPQVRHTCPARFGIPSLEMTEEDVHRRKRQQFLKRGRQNTCPRSIERTFPGRVFARKQGGGKKKESPGKVIADKQGGCKKKKSNPVPSSVDRSQKERNLAEQLAERRGRRWGRGGGARTREAFVPSHFTSRRAKPKFTWGRNRGF